MNDVERMWTLITLAAVAIIVVGVVVAWRARARSHELRRHFGPEYERTVEKWGSAALAERELEERTRRVEHFRFHELGPVERARFATRWNDLQASFATNPVVAVTATNELINEVMRARGYPTLSFEQRVADLSVEHPRVIEHYRAAHTLAGSVFNGAVDTELLRESLVHYRKLFVELLHESRGVSAPPPPLRRAHAA
jgi:hypothetical protein